MTFSVLPSQCEKLRVYPSHFKMWIPHSSTAVGQVSIIFEIVLWLRLIELRPVRRWKCGLIWCQRQIVNTWANDGNQSNALCGLFDRFSSIWSTTFPVLFLIRPWGKWMMIGTLIISICFEFVIFFWLSMGSQRTNSDFFCEITGKEEEV